MKNWRTLITSISRTTLVRAAVVLGVGGSAIGSYAGLGVLGGTVPFAEAMNLPAALAVLPDPLSIMTARSPGERGRGAMFNIKQTKRPRQLASVQPRGPRAPRERVLSNVRERDPIGGVPAGDLPIAPGGFVPDLTPVSPDALGPVGPGGGGDSFGPPPVFPTGPGGNIPGVPGPTPTPTPVTPVPAVPEPATWAMMTLGFAITGLAVRRRKRTRTTVA